MPEQEKAQQKKMNLAQQILGYIEQFNLEYRKLDPRIADLQNGIMAICEQHKDDPTLMTEQAWRVYSYLEKYASSYFGLSVGEMIPIKNIDAAIQDLLQVGLIERVNDRYRVVAKEETPNAH